MTDDAKAMEAAIDEQFNDNLVAAPHREIMRMGWRACLSGPLVKQLVDALENLLPHVSTGDEGEHIFASKSRLGAVKAAQASLAALDAATSEREGEG